MCTPEQIEKAFNEHLAKLEPFKRKAYIPETEESEAKFSSESKFGGYPYLRDENDWPTCPNCKKNMQLLLQLDLEKLPEKKQTGLVQVFYCTSEEPLCDCELESWEAFSEAVVCRIIEINGESAQIEPTIDEIFDENLIKGWQVEDDYPSSEEYENLGIDCEYDELFEEVVELMDQREIGLPISGDKLFGWPNWIQGEEYPNDRKTNTRMTYLFQIDSECNLPYMFGDSGIAHLSQSPDNKDELAFAWACC